MPITRELGRLLKVDLRKVFTTEAVDFTPWLAQADNLKLLGETVGLILQCEAQEKHVGPYRADILCRDTSDSWVLIENQIEKTDHVHLGQLLTYAAGLEAVTIIWIAETFTDEHRAALDWLNEHTDEQINFFGLEIELWQIADSPIAPKFNIISKRNDWSRAVKAAATQGGEISEHNQMQLRFGVAFKEYMEKNSQIKCPKPSPGHSMCHSIGRSDAYLGSVISTWNSMSGTYGPEIRVELVLIGDDAEQHFATLEQQRGEVEHAVGCNLTWHKPAAGKKMHRIYIREDADFLDGTLWPQHQEWLRSRLELFKKVFGPMVQKFGVQALKASP